MGIATREPQVRYSAAYPTGRERIVKVTPLPCGLSTMMLLYHFLLQEGVVKPGDVDGLVYCQYREGDDGWKLRLAKKLSAAGVVFDQRKVLEM